MPFVLESGISRRMVFCMKQVASIFVVLCVVWVVGCRPDASTTVPKPSGDGSTAVDEPEDVEETPEPSQEAVAAAKLVEQLGGKVA